MNEPKETSPPGRSPAIGIGIGIGLALVFVSLAWLDRRFGWVEPAFDAIAHMFYEVPVLAAIRRPSQLALVRMHLAVLGAIVSSGFVIGRWLPRHGRIWWAVFALAYTLRAIAWIAGGNMPLVPGDSCHYLEVATSVYRGEGPVKHYVESFFLDYPAIREDRGTLDDWATPLYAYVLAAVNRLVGVEPGRSIEETVSVAKGVSFLLNLLALPALYGLARRIYGPGVALGAMAILAILPVHVIYAGFVLRESLVCLTSILAIWTLTEIWSAKGRVPWACAGLAGLCGGLAILARNTAMALLAGAGFYALAAHARRRIGPLIAWGIVVLAVIAPWAIETNRVYGEPFFTYTKYFPYNFSWTVHHYERGNTRADQFYTWANAPSIARVKVKSLFIIACYSTMILGAPVVLGVIGRLRGVTSRGRDFERMICVILGVYVLATLVNVADVTQVAQLGRYYLPVYVLMLPVAAAGIGDWLAERTRPGAGKALALVLFAVLWADPTWAYDASWWVMPYQLHWPALRSAGDWVRSHPADVPAKARIMTWFPWEFRLAGRRTTVLMPRNYDPGRIRQTIGQYGVTHVLWGSFEPPPHVDPQSFGPYLDQVRVSIGLTDEKEVYRSPRGLPYPVRLYKIR